MNLFAYLFIGILLGPTFLGMPLHPIFIHLSTLAACLYLFTSGIELNPREASRNYKQALCLIPGVFIFPFFIGILASHYILPSLSQGMSSIFVALAFSVSALPVVIQVLRDTHLYNTKMGHLIVTTAIIVDISVWLIFLLILPDKLGADWFKSHLPIFLFFTGIAVSGYFVKHAKITKKIKMCNNLIFAPLFFSAIGLQINLKQSFNFSEVLLLILLATFSKVFGSYVIARLLRYNSYQSSMIAFSLNARGAMEILLCTIGLKAGLIDQQVFTSLVSMAVITSVMAPLLIKVVMKLQRINEKEKSS